MVSALRQEEVAALQRKAMLLQTNNDGHVKEKAILHQQLQVRPWQTAHMHAGTILLSNAQSACMRAGGVMGGCAR